MDVEIGPGCAARMADRRATAVSGVSASVTSAVPATRRVSSPSGGGPAIDARLKLGDPRVQNAGDAVPRWHGPARQAAPRHPVVIGQLAAGATAQGITSSCSIPVARPCASRTIWPFGGSGMSCQTPAILERALFRQALWNELS
jgi:hypothetical protein